MMYATRRLKDSFISWRAIARPSITYGLLGLVTQPSAELGTDVAHCLRTRFTSLEVCPLVG